MKHRVHYLTLQLILLLLPALLATITLNINNYITNSFTEFLLYIAGVIGVFPLGFLSENLKGILTESYASLISISIYIFLAFLIFNKFYQPIKKRIITVSVINMLLALWSVLFGSVFMFLAMQ